MAKAKKKSGNGAWILGSVVGAIAGAAFALWKTPMSGQELRSKLSPGPISMPSMPEREPGTGFADKVIGVVERATAPLVGVELGKTANGSTGVGSAPAPAFSSASIVPPKRVDDEIVSTNQEGATVDASVATASVSTDTIRARRFSWGDPKPEATASDVVVNELIEEPVIVADPEPVSVASTAPTTGYGHQSIRAKRFAWGSPAPEKTVDVAAVSAPTALAEVDVIETTSQPAEQQFDNADELLKEEMAQNTFAPAALLSTPASMHKFPKLGGLE